MVVDSSQGTKVCWRFVAGIEMRQADEERVEGGTEADISAVLTSLQTQGLSQMRDMHTAQRGLMRRTWRGGSYRGRRQR